MGENDSTRVTDAFNYLQTKLPDELRNPAVGVICGSGLSGIAGTVNPNSKLEIPYSEIPYFPQSTVPGHAGTLLFGSIDTFRRPIVLMLGRIHYYEGYSIQDTTFPIRLMKRLGVEGIIATNAAGAINRDYAVGDLVLLNDHISLASLAGTHPLRGPNADSFGVRFPAMSDAYDLDLRRQAHRLWEDVNRGSGAMGRLHEGIYAFVGGPSYETRAESRLVHSLGADLVGMSTVPEVIVARHCGIKVLAISLVTNNVILEAGPRGDSVQIQGLDRSALQAMLAKGKANHEEVIDAGRNAAGYIQQLVGLMVQYILDADRV